MRIGLVGDESTHADVLIDWWLAHPAAGATLEAVVAPTRPWPADTVARPEDLVGRVDAAVVLSRDAGQHAEQSIPLLAGGLPVFVDKPVADTLLGAERMLRAARDGGARLTSFSALRSMPATQAARAQAAALGGVRTLYVSCPADPERHPHGWAFYGVHGVEMALEVAGGPVGSVEVPDVEAALDVLFSCGGARVELHLAPDAPFRIAGQAADGPLDETVTTIGPGYFDATARAVTAFLRYGTAPVPEPELLDVARVVQAIGWCPPGPAAG